MCKLGGRDHNATSYSTETCNIVLKLYGLPRAEIITLRAIALKQRRQGCPMVLKSAEIITLRAIALKLHECIMLNFSYDYSRDHNATSYSTETL